MLQENCVKQDHTQLQYQTKARRQDVSQSLTQEPQSQTAQPVTNEIEGTCKEEVMLNLRYYPKICVEGLRKTIKK